MRAVVIHAPGDLRVDEVAEPGCGPSDVVVGVEYGGVCGSDLHYWRHGSAGTSVLRHPMVLGHEVAGVVLRVGDGVRDVAVGQRAAIHPASTCGSCRHCPDRPNLCSRVRYLGSAAFDPHTDGAFAERLRVPAGQVRVLPDAVSTRAGAVAEPLGVAVHAVHRAGAVRGRSVLVNGCGPIGALVVAAARHAGAASITASDLSAGTLEVARRMGADEVVDLAQGGALPGDVDVAFEASGAPAALGAVLAAVARGGTVVQVGNLPAGPISAELAALVTREIDYRGSFRFVDEISTAVELLAAGLDVEPLLTHTFPLDELGRAFATAADRTTGSSKVLLRLNG
jgi:L-idonate 5-dehydrogenase